MPSRLCVDTHACARTWRASRSHMCAINVQRWERLYRVLSESLRTMLAFSGPTAFRQGSSRALSTRFSALSIGCRAREALAHSWRNVASSRDPWTRFNSPMPISRVSKIVYSNVFNAFNAFHPRRWKRFVGGISVSFLSGYRRVSFRPESGLPDTERRAHSLRTRVDHTGRLRPARTRVQRWEEQSEERERGGWRDEEWWRWRMIISRSKASRFEKFAIWNSLSHLSLWYVA